MQFANTIEDNNWHQHGTYKIMPRLHKSQRLSYDQPRSNQTSTTSGAMKSADPTWTNTHQDRYTAIQHFAGAHMVRGSNNYFLWPEGKVKVAWKWQVPKHALYQ